MKQFILVLAVAMFLGSCRKDSTTTFNPINGDYFVFGTSYGMCVGDCAKFFAISDQQLYADTIKTFFLQPLGFSSTPLPDSKYQLAKELLSSFPTYLANSPNTTIGCPDCADQGAIHIRVKENGILKEWNIDTDISKQPAQIKDYIAKLRTILNQL